VRLLVLHSTAVAAVVTMSKQTMVRMGVNSLARMSPSTGAIVAEVAQQVEEQSRHAQKPRKAFSLHIGADLRLPTPNILQHSRFEAAKPAVSATAAAEDPFEGLPFKKLADRLGAAMSPVVQAVRLFLHPTCQDNLTCFFALGPSSMVRETCSVGHF